MVRRSSYTTINDDLNVNHHQSKQSVEKCFNGGRQQQKPENQQVPIKSSQSPYKTRVRRHDGLMHDSANQELFTPRLNISTARHATRWLDSHLFLTSPPNPSSLAGGLDHNASTLVSGHQLLPLFGGTGSQFASLTPDARACVTATYLCVLIVNNTWLDCNLLDALCNNGTSTEKSRFKAASNPSTMDTNNNLLQHRPSKQLKNWTSNGRQDEPFSETAFESALSGLLAVISGERHSGGHLAAGDILNVNRVAELNDDNPSLDHHLPLYRNPNGGNKYGLYLIPFHLSHSTEPENFRQLPIVLHDTGGGSRDKLNVELPVDESIANSNVSEQQIKSLTTNVDSQIADDYPQREAATVEPNESGGSIRDDTKGALEQYLRFRNYRSLRADELSLRMESIAQEMTADSSESDDQTMSPNDSSRIASNNSVFVDVSLTPTTTNLPSQIISISPSTTPAQNYPAAIVSWVGRPFRGWGSYSLWSNGVNVDQAIPISSQFDSATNARDNALDQIHLNRKTSTGVQILRPIDRSEQYNDISTGAQSEQKTIIYQQEPQQQSSGNAPNIAMGTSNSDELLKQASKQMFSSGYPRSAYSNGHQSTLVRDASGNLIVAASSPGASSVNAFEHQNPFLKQQHLEHLMSSSVAASSSINQQQDICKCGHSGEDECRFQCMKSHHQNSNVAPVITSQQNINDNNQMMTNINGPGNSGTVMSTSATTLISPTTASIATTAVSSSGGKMNPLDVSFLLYTRHNRDLAQELIHLSGANQQNTNTATASTTSSSSLTSTPPTTDSYNSETLLSVGDTIDITNETTFGDSRINCSLPIKIIIHGFGSGGRRPWVTDMVYKLLDYEDVNVIVVDWEKGAVLPNYVQAAGNTRIVGHKIASLIKLLNAKYGLTGNRYHLIGFSLGAHVAGFAGMEIRNSTNISRHWINRITGLDPASPLFEGYEANDRLDPSDAQFVDVIHSNGDGVLRGGFGSLQPMGHVDFYPNGGRIQVGCNSVILSALSDIIYGKWQSLCNHRRALNFFMDSFEFDKCRFRSFNCDSYENYLKGDCFDCGQNNEKCSYMGYLANYSKGRGKMYLTTHEDAPFCANQFIIKIIGSKGFKTHWGKVEVTLLTVDGKNESLWLSSVNSGQTSTTSSSATSISSSSNFNSHELGINQRELGQQSMQSLIVAHPNLVNFTQVHLRYTKYKGWIYSGDDNWPIDKVFITDSEGQVKSFCGYNTILESHITTRLNLEPGNCTLPDNQASSSSTVSSSGISQGNMQNSVSRISHSSPSLSQQNSQQQSSRTPRLLSSLIHHQSSNPGGVLDLHHHFDLKQQQQQQTQAQLHHQPVFLSNGHAMAVQRMLNPQSQFAHQVVSF